MTETEITQLSEVYANWTFSRRNDSILEITEKIGERKFEVPAILKSLYKMLPGKKLSIAIEENTHFKILVKNTKHGKYHRMYTSGCFDIFHYGHLNILRKSKELCDYLIVGVSTDELIEREKGKRPVIPYEERSRVIEAVSYVDLVIPQEDKDKQKIVDRYKIDAISVGDDWKGRYPKVSCAMEYFPYTASVSSTILKDALKLTEK